MDESPTARIMQNINSDVLMIKALISKVDSCSSFKNKSAKENQELFLTKEMLIGLKENYPDDSRIRLALGKLFKMTEETILAINEFRLAITLNDFCTDAYLEMSHLLPRNDAIDLLQKALQTIGNETVLYERYVELILEEVDSRSPEKLEVLKKVLDHWQEKDPDCSKIYLVLAKALSKIGNIQTHKDCLEKGSELFPQERAFWLERIALAEQKFNITEFANLINQALKALPQDSEILIKISESLKSNGYLQEAKNIADELIRNGGQTTFRLNILGQRPASELAKTDRLLVFVAEYPRMRLSKIAGALRERGWQVILLCMHQHDACNWNRYFDKVETFTNPEHALSLAAQYNPQAYHVFTGSGDLLTLRFVQEKLGKTIVDFYDYGEGTVADTENIEQRAYRWKAIENADGLVVRDIRLGRMGRELGLKRPSKTIFFPEYCNVTELSLPKEQGGIHIVSAGFIATSNTSEENWGFKESMKAFLENGLYVHLYPHPMQFGAATFKEDFKEFFELEKKYNNFKMHSTVHMEKLVEEMSRYHFGMSISWQLTQGKAIKNYSSNFLAKCNAARNIDYLDAGLGVIVNSQLKFQKWLLDRFKVAVEASPEFFNNPQQILSSKISDPFWRKRIEQARTNYSIKNNIARLENFYLTI